MLRGPNQNPKCFQWRWPLIEDNLKILNFETNLRGPPKIQNALNKDDLEWKTTHWLDRPKILNLNQEDQTKIKNAWNEDDLQWRWPKKIFKVEYLSNYTNQILLIC